MARHTRSRSTPPRAAAHAPAALRCERRPAASALRQVLPLGALAAGFGASTLALAQAVSHSPAPTPEVPAQAEVTLRKITVKGKGEPQGKDTLRATTTGIGKGNQDLRDIPQSVTVVTEKLILDRHLDTLKDALKNTAGISFQAAEGGEEDIRLRGFSLQSTGDIFIDGMRDPAFYERDSFNWDRLELLRGSASLLFGRGSTGGAANQVTKKPQLINRSQVDVTAGTGEYLRAQADFNVVTGEDAALRINAMVNSAANDGAGNSIDKEGLAGVYGWGIGTADEFQVGFQHLANRNGINYGLPWIDANVAGANHLWPTDPKNYYGAASDRNNGGVDYGSFLHIHRFRGGGELKTQARIGDYQRDLRASAIRFAGAASQPGGLAVSNATFGPGTVLTRGNNNKIQDMRTRYVQSDYSNKFGWFGLQHSVLTGVDAAFEGFNNYSATTLAKPTTTVGTPNDGGGVDESLRSTNTVSRSFKAKGLGVYAQDMVQVAPMWKVLGGLRWDSLRGTYDTVAATGNPATNPCAVGANTRLSRNDSLWSKRAAVLFQPTPLSSYHLSYGTSFNTSGDAYQFDAGSVSTAPESSRNIELGAKLDSADGRATARVALFHTTKYNERNRDADTVNACNYVLSGKRHAAGVELDLSGRLTPEWEIYGSYAFIPEAQVDSSSGAAGTETVGSRPGLTPRHSGTIWTTYQVTPRMRVGGGLNARSADVPVGLGAGSQVYGPKFITADLMGEYQVNDSLIYKLSITNLANKHYADMLYRGHYIPGKGRTVMLTGTFKF